MADTQWHGPERRTNHRMRQLIDELRGELRDTRQALEYLREKVNVVSVEIEVLKRAQRDKQA